MDDQRDQAERAFSAWALELSPHLDVSAEQAERQDDLHKFRVRSYRRHDEQALAIDVELMPDYPYKNKATQRRVGTVRILVPLTESDGTAYILPSVMHQLTAFLATGGINEENIVDEARDGTLVVRWDY